MNKTKKNRKFTEAVNTNDLLKLQQSETITDVENTAKEVQTPVYADAIRQMKKTAKLKKDTIKVETEPKHEEKPKKPKMASGAKQMQLDESLFESAPYDDEEECEEGVCSNCGTVLEYARGPIFENSETAYYDCICENCGKRVREVYAIQLNFLHCEEMPSNALDESLFEDAVSTNDNESPAVSIDDIIEETEAKVREYFPDFTGEVYFDDSRAWSLYVKGDSLNLPVSKFGAYRNYLGGAVRDSIQHNGRAQDNTYELGEYFATQLQRIEDIINGDTADLPEWEQPTGVLLNKKNNLDEDLEIDTARCKDILNKFVDWDDIENNGGDVDAAIDQLRNLESEGEITEGEYDYIMNHWDELLENVNSTSNEFTITPLKGNWVRFDNGTYRGEAKVFAEPSSYGIDNGHVSKLTVQCGNNRIANYDRGWDITPTTQHKAAVDTIVQQLSDYAKSGSSADTGAN